MDTRAMGKSDYLLALALGALALLAYGRTLAPDVLYGDSAEFQTLAYTLGMTHCTGYPVYLLLGRLVGYLPCGSPAWRISLLSALSAAVTVANVYLLARHFTRSRAGAAVGSAALTLSYTFWAQAVIAEVYTPALALSSTAILLLWRWHMNPAGGSRRIFAAALLLGLSPGVHASAALVAPPAALLTGWILWTRRKEGRPGRRELKAAGMGLALGLFAYLASYLALDLHNPPSSFYRVALWPSRGIWGLEATELESPAVRFWVTVSGRQWQNAMRPGEPGFVRVGMEQFGRWLVAREFAPGALACALLGFVVALRASSGLGGFLGLLFAWQLLAIASYDPPDRNVFYLPAYLPLAVATGVGAGWLLEAVQRRVGSVPGRWQRPLYLVAAAAVLLAVAAPAAPARVSALRSGAATFVEEQYPYPVYDLGEPRRVAAARLAQVPDDALLVMEWRTLYATCYLAHVEQGRTGILILESTPHGALGELTETLLWELEAALAAGRRVYADAAYPPLPARYRLRRVPGVQLYEVLGPAGAGL